MALSQHQKRVLAALHALEDRHHWAWWPREAIGVVVDAGGYHATIQRGTIRRLKALGLVQTERSSWPDNVRQLVRCTCACGTWGLTHKGRVLAAKLKIAATEDFDRRLDLAKLYGEHGVCSPAALRDDDSKPWWHDNDDDDDDFNEWVEPKPKRTPPAVPVS